MNPPWPFPVPPSTALPAPWGVPISVAGSQALVASSLSAVLPVPAIPTAIVVAPPSFPYALPYPVIYPAGIPSPSMIQLLPPSDMSLPDSPIQCFLRGEVCSDKLEGKHGVKSKNEGTQSAEMLDNSEENSVQPKVNETSYPGKGTSVKKSCQTECDSQCHKKDKHSKHHLEKEIHRSKNAKSGSSSRSLLEQEEARRPRDRSRSISKVKDKASHGHRSYRSPSIHRKHREDRKHRNKERDSHRERSSDRKHSKEHRKSVRRKDFSPKKDCTKSHKEKKNVEELARNSSRYNRASTGSRCYNDEESDVEDMRRKSFEHKDSFPEKDRPKNYLMLDNEKHIGEELYPSASRDYRAFTRSKWDTDEESDVEVMQRKSLQPRDSCPKKDHSKSRSKLDNEKHIQKGLCVSVDNTASKWDKDEDESDAELVLPKGESSFRWSPLGMKFCVKDEISDAESLSFCSDQVVDEVSGNKSASSKKDSFSEDKQKKVRYGRSVSSDREVKNETRSAKTAKPVKRNKSKEASLDRTSSPSKKRKKIDSRSRSRRSSSSPDARDRLVDDALRKQRRHHSPHSSRKRDSLRRYSSTRERRSRERECHISRARHRSKSPVLPSLSTKPYKCIKSLPAGNYYQHIEEGSSKVVATEPLEELLSKFRFNLVERSERVRATKPKYEPPKRKTKLRTLKPPKENSDDSSSSCCEDSSSDDDTAMEELERKRQHPDRLHLELWFNDPKEMNDGPLCRCSAKARRAGIRHGIYVGEDHLPLCDPLSNNVHRLHHYRVTMTPVTNFLTENPTKIHHNGHDYIFEGFSLFSHTPLPKLPNCKVIRFNYEYTILYIEEPMLENFTVEGLELFTSYLMNEILELVDLNWKAHNDPDGCPRFHFMPRFSRELKDGGRELLAHSFVLEYLLQKNEVLIDSSSLSKVLNYHNRDWQKMADKVKGMIVTCPGKKPSSIRVDQLDREQCGNDETYPVIVHFGVRPPQLSYAGNPSYQKAWREYVKYRHLLANKPKVKHLDRHKLLLKETRLQEMRMENDLKRDVTVVISSKDFYKTGIMSDIIQHAMLLPVLVCHLRFHQSLNFLEEKISYKFQDRYLLQLALTHPSYRENFGTNPDHARNSLTNCGLRQPQYGDRRIHYMNTRKRGINTLINIMSRFGSQKETLSCINHNERLEFLGDAVVEFLSSIHLFYMFPDLEEGGLATYRAAIVQNQHLAVLAKKLELDKFMLYAHGSDLCHDLELRHAMANCFEALMGALFLDNGIEIADKVFSETLFSEPELLDVWTNFSPHPLQEQEPDGDRKWIASVPLLQKLNKFEEMIGIEFNHIRLLARALTHRSLGYNNLTLGSNQRLEFLGDTVLQLVASEYLYKFFPEHHEGHLSLLRSSLVNNRTQAVVCADLGMVDFAIYPYSKVELKPKDKADLLEAFLGALYVDKDLSYCRKFCEVCFFPRLQDFIMNQEWNDPKSKLQQCCLTLRSMDGGEPDIPTYKVIECKGPTNTRVYSVAVYFQRKRLAVGSGHSIQQAEMDAAANALMKSKDLFPQLKHQRRAIERSLKHGIKKKVKKSSKQ